VAAFEPSGIQALAARGENHSQSPEGGLDGRKRAESSRCSAANTFIRPLSVVLRAERRADRSRLQTVGDLPAETDASRALSKALKKRGFGFVGPTICYAFMSGRTGGRSPEWCFRARA
jgi:hypothetical protein